MSKIKAVIFDKDGTLHDTEKIFVEAWSLAAQELSVPDIESTVQDCTGMPLQDIARYWAVKYPTIPFEDYIARRQYHFERLTADGVPVKPDPAGLQLVLDALGAERETTLYVGDSNVDMETARSGGLVSCGVTWGFRGRRELQEAGAVHLADTAEELLSLAVGQ